MDVGNQKRASRVLSVESLEGRELLATLPSIEPPDAAGVVEIRGTNGPDHITIEPTAGDNHLRVTIRHELTGRLLDYGIFDYHQVKKIEVDALGGNDYVHNLAGNINSDIRGGRGNDWIESRGTGAFHFVRGEQGDDHLFGALVYGGSGRDVMGGEELKCVVVQDILRCVSLPLPGYRGGYVQDAEPHDIVITPSAGYRNDDVRVQSIGSIVLVNGTNSGNKIILEQSGSLLSINTHSSTGRRLFWAPAVTSVIVNGYGGNDQIINRTSKKMFAYGGDGEDRIVGGTSLDYILGQSGHDALYGNGGGDWMWGDDGHDLVFGGSGTDFLRGGRGNDIVRGGSGHDILYGDAGNDRLMGDSGNDLLRGGDHQDELYGGTGWDRLYGDAGHDRLDGGGDGTRDYLNGGTGYDAFVRHLDDYWSIEEEQHGDRPERTETVNPLFWLTPLAALMPLTPYS